MPAPAANSAPYPPTPHPQLHHRHHHHAQEITRKIKKWQCVNFGLTLLQLTASIAVISVIANRLQVVSIAADAGAGATSGKWSYAVRAFLGRGGRVLSSSGDEEGGRL